VQYGVCGETAVVPADALVNKPDNLSFEAGAAVWMAYPTAYGGLVYRGGLKKGVDQAVVISAASSSVGIAAIQTAKDHGATVIATTRTDAKKEPLMAAGADHVIVTQQENLVDRVYEITAGKGFDIALDPVAGPFLSELAEAAKPEARIVEYGVLSMARTDFPLFPAIGKGFQVSGFHVVYHLFQHAQRFAGAKAYILDGLQRGALQPVISQTFDLTQVVEAYNYMGQNDQFGKIVIKTS
jgi:NADPH:quinone reductase-like Zn-dependent oxidoreductase